MTEPTCQEPREVIAETFFDGATTGTLRHLATNGGLRSLLQSHCRLIDACDLALPHLGHAPGEVLSAVKAVRDEAESFHAKVAP